MKKFSTLVLWMSVLAASFLHGGELLPRFCKPYSHNDLDRLWITQQTDAKAAHCALGYFYETRAKQTDSPIIRALDLARLAQILRDLREDYQADVNRSLVEIRHRFKAMNRELRTKRLIDASDRRTVALAREHEKLLVYRYDKDTLRLRIAKRPHFVPLSAGTTVHKRCFPLYEDPELRWKTGDCLTQKELKKALRAVEVEFGGRIYYLDPDIHEGGKDETVY